MSQKDVSWKKGAGQQEKHALDLTWVGLPRRSTFKITRAASKKSWGLCTYRGVSMGEQQEARCKLVSSLEFTATTNPDGGALKGYSSVMSFSF